MRKIFPSNINNLGPYWLYTDLAQLWKHWLNKDSIETFLKGKKKTLKKRINWFHIGGYYSQLTKLNDSLRIISLNTILWLSENINATDYGSDPADQFKWLQQTLQRSTDNKEKVKHIAKCICFRSACFA